MNSTFFAYLFAFLALIVFLFQIALAAGMPWGHLAWGGRYGKILPKKVRISSAFAIPLLVFFSIMFLQYVELIPVFIGRPLSTIILSVITAFFALTILGNVTSKSKHEKIVMTPVASLIFIISLLIVIFG